MIHIINMNYDYEYNHRLRLRQWTTLFWTSMWRQASTPELKEAYRQRMLNAEAVEMNYKGMEI